MMEFVDLIILFSSELWALAVKEFVDFIIIIIIIVIIIIIIISMCNQMVTSEISE